MLKKLPHVLLPCIFSCFPHTAWRHPCKSGVNWLPAQRQSTRLAGQHRLPDGDNDALCPVLCQPVCTRRFVLMLMRRRHISIQGTSDTYGPLTAWQRWAEPWFVNQRWWIASKTNLTEVTKRRWSQICYFCRTVYLDTRPWRSIPLPLSVFITQMTSICFSLAVFLWLLFFKGASACMPERMAH